MNKLLGYAGRLLRVDLTNEQFVEERLDEESTRKYIGGTGTGAKYLFVFEEGPAGVGWSDYQSPLGKRGEKRMRP